MRVSQVSLLQEYLERNVAQHPDKVALIVKEQRLTWSDVHQRATAFAAQLRQGGIKRGDRVVLYIENSVELCTSMFGVLLADGVFCIVNAQTKADKLAYILCDCRATAMVASGGLLKMLETAVPRSEHLANIYLVTDKEAPSKIGAASVTTLAEPSSAADQPLCKNIPVDLAAIIYTSGTTGDPKGVMLTHHAMVSAAESITSYLGNRHEDIVVNVLPMSFDYGLYQWIMVTQFGGTLVLEKSFSFPSPILKLIDAENVTGFPVVPTIASLLKTFAAKGLRLEKVRYVTNTAAALSGSHIETLKQICPNAQIFSMYGLTECKRVAYLPPDRIAEKPDSVGVAMPNMEAFVVDGEGRRLPAGATGELVVRGPHLMKGYWEKPEASAERLKPGELPGEMWLYTGDLFRIDDEGFLYFVSRKDDIIKSRGEKVSPKEVENALYNLQGVQDAVVAGTDDPVLGQAIHAFVVLNDGGELNKRQVVKHCAANLEPFMVPKFVSFLSSVPKTSSNKITRKGIWEHARNNHVSGDAIP